MAKFILQRLHCKKESCSPEVVCIRTEKMSHLPFKESKSDAPIGLSVVTALIVHSVILIGKYYFVHDIVSKIA
jgi:hypothetical protein